MDWDQFTLIDLEALTPSEVFERGLDYYRNGHLIVTARIDDVRAGIVIGTGGDYLARLWIEDETLRYGCSCPYPDFCKHLVALANGWLDDKARFIDLRPPLDAAIQDSLRLPALLTRLVYENPLNFMKLVENNPSPLASRTSSQNSREMVNLIRNIFKSAPLCRLSHLENFREQLTRVENLLQEQLAAGNPDALPHLVEMIQGMAAIYKGNRLPELATYLRKLLFLPVGAGESYTEEAIAGLYRMIFQSYFDPDLWEFKEELKAVLLGLHSMAPQLLPELISKTHAAGPDSNNNGMLYRISLYELLATEGMAPINTDIHQVLEKVIQDLSSTVEGRLWLIDRLMASDLSESYRLTRTALAGGMEPKRSFRDRLIEIHRRRSEFRQAASLSFIQFLEEPNFEEYLRLKEILTRHPADWRSYLQRVRAFLDKTGNDILSFRIAIDQGDCQAIKTRIGETAQTPALLLAVAGLFIETGTPETAQVYPQIIRLLLAETIFSCWNAALQMITIYKKMCRQSGWNGEWESFRDELLKEHTDDGRFRRKFGGVLREG
jgi:hypothetical protein